jgi:hypothetical protein
VPPCSKTVLCRENVVFQNDGQARLSLGTKTSFRVQGFDFDLVGTSWKVVIHEAQEAARTR